MSWAYWQRGLKGQPGGILRQVGRQAADCGELLALLVQPRDRVQQALGVRMGRAGVQLEDVGLLDDPAGVHDRDPVGHVGDHAEVVGDQDQAHLPLLLQLLRAAA